MLEIFQNFQNHVGRDPHPFVAQAALQNVDALFQGEGVPLPSTVFLYSIMFMVLLLTRPGIASMVSVSTK